MKKAIDDNFHIRLIVRYMEALARLLLLFYFKSVMLRFAISLVFCMILISVVMGQTTFQPKPIEYNLKGVVYSTERLFEVRPHLQGFSVAIKKGKLQSYYHTTYQSYEFGFYKDSRERRQEIFGERIGTTTRDPFIYGKRSQFFTFRLTYGQKRYLSEKTRRKGVAMGFIYEGGASLGLIKPYFLRVIRRDPNLLDPTVETLTYSEDTHDDFLNFDNIYGGTSFWRGFEDITPTLGLHGKVGLHWAIGAFEEKVKAVEVGLMVDVFPREIPLMVEREDVKNSFLLAKLYASYQFGRRKL